MLRKTQIAVRRSRGKDWMMGCTSAVVNVVTRQWTYSSGRSLSKPIASKLYWYESGSKGLPIRPGLKNLHHDPPVVHEPTQSNVFPSALAP